MDDGERSYWKDQLLDPCHLEPGCSIAGAEAQLEQHLVNAVAVDQDDDKQQRNDELKGKQIEELNRNFK